MIWATNRSIRVRNHGHGIDTTSAVRFAFPGKRAAFFYGHGQKGGTSRPRVAIDMAEGG